jgi:hypothetical protein
MAKQVEVLIWVNQKTQVCVRPKRVVISESEGDEVAWRCLEGEAKITFKKDSPFEASQFPIARSAGALSGSAKDGSNRGPAYEYGIEVTLPGISAANQPPPLDPEVQVDP